MLVPLFKDLLHPLGILEWDRFLLYSRNTLYLRINFSSFPQSLFFAIISTRPSTLLFPRLIALQTARIPQLLAISSQLISESLRSLTVHTDVEFAADDNDDVVLRGFIVNTLTTYALEELQLVHSLNDYGSPSSTLCSMLVEELKQSFSQETRSRHTLKSLKLGLSPAQLKCIIGPIGHLPGLESLGIEVPAFTERQLPIATSHLPMFPALKSLRITAEDWLVAVCVANEVLNLPGHQELNSFHVDTDHACPIQTPSSASLRDVLISITRHPPINLSILNFDLSADAIASEVSFSPDEPDDCISSRIVEPLHSSAFHSLTELSIMSPLLVKLSHNDIIAFTCKMPQLRSFVLAHNLGFYDNLPPPLITMKTITALTRSCPYLSYLGLAVDFSIATLQIDDPTSPEIREWDLFESHTDNPKVTADFIWAHFPNLHTIMQDTVTLPHMNSPSIDQITAGLEAEGEGEDGHLSSDPLSALNYVARRVSRLRFQAGQSVAPR